MVLCQGDKQHVKEFYKRLPEFFGVPPGSPADQHLSESTALCGHWPLSRQLRSEPSETCKAALVLSTRQFVSGAPLLVPAADGNPMELASRHGQERVHLL